MFWGFFFPKGCHSAGNSGLVFLLAWVRAINETGSLMAFGPASSCFMPFDCDHRELLCLSKQADLVWNLICTKGMRDAFRCVHVDVDVDVNRLPAVHQLVNMKTTTLKAYLGFVLDCCLVWLWTIFWCLRSALGSFLVVTWFLVSFWHGFYWDLGSLGFRP